MSDLTAQCLACGSEYVPIATEPGECPDCGSPATPPVGDPLVLDVRAQASLDAAAGADAVPDLEVLVSDDTDRVITVTVETAEGGREARIAGATFGDETVTRSDEHWSEDVVPDCVYEQATEYLADIVRQRERRVQ